MPLYLAIVQAERELIVLEYGAVQVGSVSDFYRLGDSAATALTHPDYCRFTHRTTSRPQLLLAMFGAFFAADVSLVHLHDAAQDLQLIAARLPEPL